MSARLSIGQRRREPLTYDEYRGLDRFPALDGLRAVSILLVVVWHVNPSLLAPLSGYEGVTIFFVISGYLITTLLLREKEATGAVSLRAFYIRRAFRILPLYYLVLAVYVLGFAIRGAGQHRALFAHALPYYLSYANDFAPLAGATPFAQSWSLGVEEKFYLVWPILAFVVCRRHPSRIVLAAGLALLPVFFEPFGIVHRWTAYGSILVGCLLALLLHDRRTYTWLVRLAKPKMAWAIFAALVATHVAVHSVGLAASLAYPFVVAAFFVPALASKGCRWVWVLESAPMGFIGRRAYGVYLVHLLCISFVFAALRHAGISVGAADKLVGPWAPAATAAAAVGAVGLSLAVAHGLHRAVEQPLIALGRRLSRRTPATAVEPSPVTAT